MEKYKELNVLKDKDPIFDAIENGDVATAEKFLKAGGSSYTASRNNPHLASYAINNGHIEIVKLMLAHDLKINGYLNKFGDRPLHFALQRKNFELVKLFVEEGADVNAPTEHGMSPLHCAAGGGQEELVRYLISKGANLHAKNQSGATPFRDAAKGNHIAAMKVLLEAGAKIEETDCVGDTALIGCAGGGKLEAVQWLLDHGANIRAKDKNGKTALDWAKANKHAKIVELLQQRLGN